MNEPPFNADDPPGAPWAASFTPPRHADEPSISDLVAAAEIAWRNLLVLESQTLQSDGCCSTDTWRGHLCQYHQGFEDGIDIVLDRLRAIREMTDGL